MNFLKILAAAILLSTVFLIAPVAAEDEPEAETTPFAGSAIVLTLKDEKVVMTFEGQTIATADGINLKVSTELEGVPVAVFGTSDFSSDGGASCSGNIVVWKETDEPLRHAKVNPDCRDRTEPSVDQTGAIFFVPYAGPGTDKKPVWAWYPHNGMVLVGLVSFAPQPGTGWADVKQAEFDRIYEFLHNEEVYEAVKALLGDRLDEVVDALVVGVTSQTMLPSGIIYGTGCKDLDSCGNWAGALMAVDPKAKTVYFALQTGNGIDMWPPMAAWPAKLIDVVKKSMPTG